MKQLETDIFSLNKKTTKTNIQIDLISAQTATLVRSIYNQGLFP